MQEGPASQSYGLQVAQLAGVPAPVIQAAKRHLLHLEQQGISNGIQGDLFVEAPQTAVPTALEEALLAIEPNELSPKAALELIYRLKNL